MNKTRKSQLGVVNGWLVTAIAFIVLFLAAGSFAIWSFVQYSDLKTNFDARTDVAVAEAVKKQADESEAKFAEREKEPNDQFVGPDEYGRVTFRYPKTWSVFVESSGQDRNDYKAYLSPGVVPPIREDSRYAVRVEILNKNFDDVNREYERLTEDGAIKISNVEINGNAGVRYDGAFSDTRRGAVTLLRVRDKTIRLSTDADTFKPDYDEVLKTVQFNN
ncbi:hypothetical protein FJZ39_02855 [Candidatus Saccharibacteria bacterium]|nr:hypothetical protein [Candidatus Saccharibacteria bacterium]